MSVNNNHRNELIVLSLIGGGMILVVVLVVVGLFGWFESKANAPLPNWAENVLVSLVSVLGLKLGDVLNALVTLATGRQVEVMGDRLAASQPVKPVKPKDTLPEEQIEEAVDRVTDAAVNEADQIKGEA